MLDLEPVINSGTDGGPEGDHHQWFNLAVISSVPAEDIPGIIGMFLWMLIFLLVGVSYSRARIKYFRLYRTKKDPNLPPMDQVGFDLYSNEPGRHAPCPGPIDAIRLGQQSLELIKQQQEDPELAAARRRVRWHQWLRPLDAG